MSTVLDRPADVAPTAVRPAGRRRVGSGVGLIGPLAVLGLLFGYPIVMVVRQTFQDRLGRPAGLLAWGRVLASAEFRTALGTTVELAVGSTIGCVVIGTFLAIVLALVPFPGSVALSRLTTVILAFPSFFIALSFAVLYGRTGVLSALVGGLTGTHEALGGFIYTRWAVLLAEITFYTPFVVRPVLAACQRVAPEQLQVAASLGAKPWRVTRQVLLPELLPSIVAGATLCLMLTLNEFGIVLFIGAKGVSTLPVLIYTKGIVSFDYPSAAVLSCVQVALSLALYLAGRFVVRRIGGHRAGLD
jgi:2-aminoethylphosphonate transport system permease protein